MRVFHLHVTYRNVMYVHYVTVHYGSKRTDQHYVTVSYVTLREGGKQA